MSGDQTLFPGHEPPEQPDLSDLSADQRRTLRQAADVAAGRHPLTGGDLHHLASRHRDASASSSDPFTCGSCYFRQLVRGPHQGRYPKCLLPAASVGADAPARAIYTRVTNGAASDVRAWWPACPAYSPGDTSLSPDAARSVPQ